MSYCTDIEGNYTYWKRFIQLSTVLYYSPSSPSSSNSSNQIFLKKDCYFIYGGDVCDRGSGDLRILNDLIQLKLKYPENVYLILGNRDLNKMRLLTELQEEGYQQQGETFWTGQITQTDEFNASNRLKAVCNH